MDFRIGSGLADIHDGGNVAQDGIDYFLRRYREEVIRKRKVHRSTRPYRMAYSGSIRRGKVKNYFQVGGRRPQRRLIKTSTMMTNATDTKVKGAAGDPIPPKYSISGVHVGQLKQLGKTVNSQAQSLWIDKSQHNPMLKVHLPNGGGSTHQPNGC